MKFNKKAYEAEAHVVRVHSADIGKNTDVQAALAAAAHGCRIVLTASYAKQDISPTGTKLKYVAAVQQQLPQCSIQRDAFSNILIW